MSRITVYKLVGREVVPATLDDPAHQDQQSRDVAKTTIANLEVSTVFLMIDHSLRGQGPPVVFETMVFADEDYAGLDYWTARYCTYEQALAGHNAVVQVLRDAFAQSLTISSELLDDLRISV